MLAGGLMHDRGRHRARRVERPRHSPRAPPGPWPTCRRIGAIGGFVAYTYALRHLPVSFVSLYAYINPVIAVTLGVLLLGEPFNSRMATAALLVFAGSPWCASRPAAAPHLRRRRR